jgi:hypothetical protein
MCAAPEHRTSDVWRSLIKHGLVAALGLFASTDLAGAQQTSPPPELQIETPSVFGDWVAGCDNTLTCHIVSLNATDGSDSDLRMSIRHQPQPGIQPVVTVEVGGPDTEWKPGQYRVAIDGIPQGPTFDRDQAPFRIFQENGQQALRSLLGASSVSIVDANGWNVASASTNGLAEALRFVDRKLGLNGTSEAMVETGPNRWVPAAPPMPVIVRPPLSTLPPTPLPQEVLEDVRRSFGCRRMPHPSHHSVRSMRLDERMTLVIVAPPCGGAPYNTTSLAMLVDNEGVARRAELESPPTADTTNEVVNAFIDPQEQTLMSHGRGRGLGDCGMVQGWAWDGAMFRLFQQKEMPRCAGSFEFIETWRARLADR